jgi:hypothetical protein
MLPSKKKKINFATKKKKTPSLSRQTDRQTETDRDRQTERQGQTDRQRQRQRATRQREGATKLKPVNQTKACDTAP